MEKTKKYNIIKNHNKEIAIKKVNGCIKLEASWGASSMKGILK